MDYMERSPPALGPPALDPPGYRPRWAARASGSGAVGQGGDRVQGTGQGGEAARRLGLRAALRGAAWPRRPRRQGTGYRVQGTARRPRRHVRPALQWSGRRPAANAIRSALSHRTRRQPCLERSECGVQGTGCRPTGCRPTGCRPSSLQSKSTRVHSRPLQGTGYRVQARRVHSRPACTRIKSRHRCGVQGTGYRPTGCRPTGCRPIKSRHRRSHRRRLQ